ncbi:PREDICTED: ubiquitin domain-containing protein DSK2b-like isoform X4 [Camelina sativa]|uniref:Ubiquitin domain-containing protein DSK2b-like isoform X4 n=1 Tax=Camelina sativa TaxID=90675 RepID=A0ABM1RCS5_CAMSA|nr:PREDICTED: ubiquitin domain-containing protein DSK2b-like isoform X4 [Camelina sativa]
MGGEGDSSQPQTGEGEAVTVNIRCSNGTKFNVKTSLESTVESFKELVAQSSDVPANQQRLIYKGRILKDDQTLLSYGLQADHTIHMVRGSAPSSEPPSAPAANVGNQTTAPSVTRGVGSDNSSNLGGGASPGESLFPGLGFNPLGSGNAMPGLFGAGLQDFEQAQQQLAQNPNMVRDMMNTPAIQNLMNNPEFMRSMIMSNPQMRELVDRNPELGHVLNDPSILRQTLEAARNPELMREMMRNTDRAMSNIESMPEGFNMLRRMYENVQEPFLNATTMSENAGSNTSSNPFAALLGNQGGTTQGSNASNNSSTPNAETGTGNSVPNANPLPNPWGATGGPTTAPGRTNPGGDARSPGLGGLGGLEMLGADSPLGATPDASQLGQLLQNPAMSQMMQSMLSNPQYMNQLMNLNPQLRTMLDSNPQLREMMQNPDFLRQFSSPEMMQQMMTLQQSLMSQNRNTTSQDPGQTGAATGTGNNAGLDALMNMFGSLGAGGLSGTNQPNVPPEERYATQLQQLQEMGFYDRAENIRALLATNGNVNAAVERLLGSIGQ